MDKCFHFIFKMPVSFLLHMTVPLVDFEQPENNWNKYLNSFHLFSAPVTISLLTKSKNPIQTIKCANLIELCFFLKFLSQSSRLYSNYRWFLRLGTSSRLWSYSICYLFNRDQSR